MHRMVPLSFFATLALLSPVAGAMQGVAVEDDLACASVDRDVACRHAVSGTGDASAAGCRTLLVPPVDCAAASGTGDASCRYASLGGYQHYCVAVSVMGAASANDGGTGLAVSATGRAHGGNAVSACNLWSGACISPG